MPILALLLLCSFLDRTNVGNAKILGLEADLGISDEQYSQGLAVFYATYIAWFVEPPSLSHSPLSKQPSPSYNVVDPVSMTDAANSPATSSSRKSPPGYGSPP